MIACVCEQGAKIRREGERFIVCGKGEPKTLFSHKLEQLILAGNVHLTSQARTLLLARNIDTVFLSSSGKYLGRLCTCETENILLRKQQFDLLDDESFRLTIAKSIVKAKLHNQAAMLARLKREHHIKEAEHGLQELKNLGSEAGQAASLESLRGIEGSGAAAYFKFFSMAFHHDWGFHKRVRRPPTDPVNATLSLIYTLLADRCHTACRLAGLDPYPANLHALEYGRMSLPLDLMEEFRAIFADAIAISLFNLGQLKPTDFEQAPESGEMESGSHEKHYGIILQPEAFKKVLSAFARKMSDNFRLSHNGQETSYAEAINAQAVKYRKAVEAGIAIYEPILWH